MMPERALLTLRRVEEAELNDLLDNLEHQPKIYRIWKVFPFSELKISYYLLQLHEVFDCHESGTTYLYVTWTGPHREASEIRWNSLIEAVNVEMVIYIGTKRKTGDQVLN